MVLEGLSERIFSPFSLAKAVKICQGEMSVLPVYIYITSPRLKCFYAIRGMAFKANYSHLSELFPWFVSEQKSVKQDCFLYLLLTGYVFLEHSETIDNNGHVKSLREIKTNANEVGK